MQHYKKDQIIVALQLLDKLKSPHKVMRILGYPGKSDTLYRWNNNRSKYILPAEENPDIPPFETRMQKVNQDELQRCMLSGMSVQSISKELGYSINTVYKWRRIFYERGNKIDMTRKKYTHAEKNGPSQRELDSLKTQMMEMQLEIDILKETINVLKKDPGIDQTALRNREKAMIVDALKNKYSLPILLKKFELSRSSYYYHEKIKRLPDKYKKLRVRITELFYENHSRYGYRRIHCLLKREGVILSEKIVRRIMQEEKLYVIAKKKRAYNAYQGEITAAVENVLNRDFHAEAPNQKWLTDITEFSIPSGKVYLSPIIDCFDGMPVVWEIGTTPNAEMVNSMLDMGISLLNEDEKPIVHSDRGNHYRWPGWIERMEKAQLTRSMSKKGCSPDNSACEGFFGRLKNEMFYGRSWDNVSIETFIQTVDNYIYWYREKRIKMSLGGLSPLEYRRSKGIAT